MEYLFRVLIKFIKKVLCGDTMRVFNLLKTRIEEMEENGACLRFNPFIKG